VDVGVIGSNQRAAAFSLFSLALAGRSAGVCACFSPLRADLSRQSMTGQIDIGQRQRREGAVRILG